MNVNVLFIGQSAGSVRTARGTAVTCSANNPVTYRDSMYDKGRGMVLGLGTDLIETSRIQESIERFGQRFLARIYTEAEIAYCMRKKNPAESFAARFAAKEAGAKALGTGISRGVSWLEIEVGHAPGGKPTLHLSGRAHEIAHTLGVRSLSVSLTHSREMAMAVVVAEG